MGRVIVVYVTCENRAQAEDIGRAILKKRLGACINVIDNVESLYFWPPKKHLIEESTETALLVKTTESKWAALEKLVKKLHTYTNPDIMAMPVSHISTSYLTWMTGELS